jgi:8-amino-7-oxononanoate synthase
MAHDPDAADTGVASLLAAADQDEARGPGREPGGYHARALSALARRGRLRSLAPRSGIDFTSNDYLGLANSPELKAAALAAIEAGIPIGAGGSRLLRGNHDQHEALEAEAARFFGAQSALYFGGGFQANAALLASLPARGDLVVYDALVHASVVDGIGLTKATTAVAAHNDPDAVADAIAAWRRGGGTGRPWIAVESVYSMDGDRAPLADLMAVADRHDAMLLVDEAHATGCLGPGGRGLAAALEGRENVICLHTCGKALGASGALITGPAVIRDFLVNRARAFIYATAPSPVMAAVVRRALALVDEQPWRRDELAARVARTGQLLAAQAIPGSALPGSCLPGSGLPSSGTPIQPIIVGSDARATALAAHMQAAGYDIRAIRPPTVPEGTARARIVLSLNVTLTDIDAMLATLAQALEKIGAPASRVHLAKADAPKPSATSNGQRSAPAVVVTGTGTGVGKTVFAAGLAAALDGTYWKPVQSGLDGPTDTDTVRDLSGLPADRFLPEAYRLKAPLAPFHSAMLDRVTIDTCRLVPPATDRPLVIEGAGGLMVPLSADCDMIDLFDRWNLPVILVASTALGTINHTLLSLAAMRARHIRIAGVAFVGAENAPTETFIAHKASVERLGRLPHLPALDRPSLHAAFAEGFDLARLKRALAHLDTGSPDWQAP